MGAKIQYLCAMDYTGCLSYLYSKLPMFSKIGAEALKFDLDNTIAICKSLGHPESKIRLIHIAGTNGKGSVSHMIASILQEQGFKTGLYTSPHLHDFRERIKVNGEMIPEEKIIDFTQKMIPLIDQINPSFFEVTVGMAFEYFSQEEVDFAVIETGLGGRLDSTNVITPILSVITNIGFDHMNILGDTLQKIATEKAGIIKNNIPVVIGKRNILTDDVFIRAADENGSELIFAEDVYHSEILETQKGILKIGLSNRTAYEQKIFTTPLAGFYQAENIRTVLTAIDTLKQLSISISNTSVVNGIEKVIQNTGLMGRWEMISEEPMIILDVAHNPAGIEKLIDQINQTSHNNLYIILGLSKDKDADGILDLLPKNANYGFTQAHLPRAMETKELVKKAELKNLKGKGFASVNDALAHFKKLAMSDDLIIVCGSIFVVGEVTRQPSC
jgi:dihydrofolate synthase/folylpolyglutamate synthase